MRVLIIAAEDEGSNLSQLCMELRRAGQADARCLVLGGRQDRLAVGDVSVFADGGEELRTLLAAADHVHLVDTRVAATDVAGTPLAELVTGRRCTAHVRRLDGAAADELAAFARASGGGVCSERPTLASSLGATFLPPFVPVQRGIYRPLPPGTRGRADLSRKATVHASSLVPFRRRPNLEALVDRAEIEAPAGVAVDTMVAERQSRVLRRKRHAEVALGAWDDGIGRSGIEALCQGVRLIAACDRDSLEAYASWTGAPAPVEDAAGLEAALAELRPREDSPEEVATWAARMLAPGRYFETLRAVWTTSI